MLQIAVAMINHGPLAGADVERLTTIAGGTIYPALARLDAVGWTSSRWEKADPVALGRPLRHVHALTKAGRASAIALLATLVTTQNHRQDTTP